VRNVWQKLIAQRAFINLLLLMLFLQVIPASGGADEMARAFPGYCAGKLMEGRSGGYCGGRDEVMSLGIDGAWLASIPISLVGIPRKGGFKTFLLSPLLTIAGAAGVVVDVLTAVPNLVGHMIVEKKNREIERRISESRYDSHAVEDTNISSPSSK
jgi:hypothetical protein